MRSALNENPVVRAVLLAGLAVISAFLLYSRVLSAGEESTGAPSPVESAAPGGVASPGGVAPSDGGAPPVGAAPPADAAVAGELVAGKGLPGPVVEAYDNGKVVALLVIKPRGIDDRKLRREVAPINDRGDAAVFVVPAKNVARYSQITLGVSLNRLPALVVVAPGGGDRPPQASVSYGFRGTRSASQAVRDALYEGGKARYFPE